MCTTVDYNNGTEECVIALVFSCPGTEEEKSQKLVSGKTGENLDIVLQYLSKKLSSIFHSADRYDYRITNSSNIVHPNANDSRTQPLNSEIKAENNLNRLYSEIKEYKYVISFGKKAKFAVDSCIEGNKQAPHHIHYRLHLGLQSINRQIKQDINGNEIVAGKNKNERQKNNQIRLEVIKKELLAIIQKESKSA